MTRMFPVLLYHSVSDDPPRGGSWGAVPRVTFATHVDAIASSGREAISLTTLAQGLRGERTLPERPVVVTFDDGYSDTYAAVELLRSRDLVSTIYITTGGIDARGRLSSEQIASLANLPGIEIGAHGVRHRRLDELDDRELLAELQDSKSRLEGLIGSRIYSFAYPHGAYDRHVRGAVIGRGYNSAAAVKNAVSHVRDDPFAIARWTVSADTQARRIAQVLEGEDVRPAWTRQRLRTRTYRAARRQRRHLLGFRSGKC